MSTGTDPGSVTSVWGAIATLITALAGLVTVGLVARKDRSPAAPAEPERPVTVTTPDGVQRTHDAADPAAMVGIVEDLAEVVATIPDMQRQISGLLARVERAEGHASDLEDDIDDLHDGINTGRYPPLPERRQRPDWLRPRR